MNKTVRRQHYKRALNHWSKPLTSKNHFTCSGFCLYFKYYGYDLYKEGAFQKFFPELYDQRIYKNNPLLHYSKSGHHLHGRIERTKALTRALKMLEEI